MAIAEVFLQPAGVKKRKDDVFQLVRLGCRDQGWYHRRGITEPTSPIALIGEELEVEEVSYWSFSFFTSLASFSFLAIILLYYKIIVMVLERP